jgi:hypothetical protein
VVTTKEGGYKLLSGARQVDALNRTALDYAMEAARLGVEGQEAACELLRRAMEVQDPGSTGTLVVRTPAGAVVPAGCSGRNAPAALDAEEDALLKEATAGNVVSPDPVLQATVAAAAVVADSVRCWYRLDCAQIVPTRPEVLVAKVERRRAAKKAAAEAEAATVLAESGIGEEEKGRVDKANKRKKKRYKSVRERWQKLKEHRKKKRLGQKPAGG